MYPDLGDLWGGDFPLPTHDVFVGLGVLVAAIIFGLQMRHTRSTDERLIAVVAGALIGGAIFMRLGTWLQHVDLRENAGFVEHWLYGNKSILGGLVGAWLGVHIAKKLTGYRPRTGDLFAPAVALGMAVGRIGCYLTESPGGDALSVSFLYEIAFHLLAFGVLWWVLRDRLQAPGESLVLYLAAYGVFRFGVEFVRGNEVVWWGLTRPQLFLALTVPLLLVRVIRQARRGRYRLAPRVPATGDTLHTPESVLR
ncbi:MAG: prolipoprotein diacylglyceryl transferase family protein [Ornithinimicrobium sp.]